MSDKKKPGRPPGGRGRSRERGDTKPITFELSPAIDAMLRDAVEKERRTKRAIIELALQMYFRHRGYLDTDPAIPPD